MSRVFSVSGYWNDNGEHIDNYLVTDIHETPDGYEDEDIFFYGLDESELTGNQGDFTITSYTTESEG